MGSYTPDEILKRMLRACEEGCTEIWMTSEDTGAFGLDINTNIAQLLKLLVSNIPENVMLRIGMTNPPYILNHLEAIAQALNHPRVFAFLHIPVQSGSNITLERMNREYTREEFCKVADYLLEHVPDMTIATDIITGFPGETYEDHLETMTLMEKYQFPVTNISQFYPRPGTVAQKMKQCNGKDKKLRSKEVTIYFESYRNCNRHLNRTERVYISEAEETKKHGLKCIGHTKNYTKVIIDYDASLIGKQILMKITNCMKWHIEGEILERDCKPEEVNPLYFVDPEEALKKVKKTQKGQKWRFNVNEENGQRDDNLKKEQSCGTNCDCGDSKKEQSCGTNCDCGDFKVDEKKDTEINTEKNTKASDQETDEDIEEDVAENTEESKQIVYENSSKVINSSY